MEFAGPIQPPHSSFFSIEASASSLDSFSETRKAGGEQIHLDGDVDQTAYSALRAEKLRMREGGGRKLPRYLEEGFAKASAASMGLGRGPEAFGENKNVREHGSILKAKIEVDESRVGNSGVGVNKSAFIETLEVSPPLPPSTSSTTTKLFVVTPSIVSTPPPPSSSSASASAATTAAAASLSVRSKPCPPPKKLLKGVGQAVKDWKMIEGLNIILLFKKNACTTF